MSPLPLKPRFPSALMLCLFAFSSTLESQEVRLPLEQFHELQRRVEAATPIRRTAAPFVLERATLEVTLTHDRASLVERLDLVISEPGWHRLELPSPGRWVSAEFGSLEGRLVEGGEGVAFRGQGRHTVELAAVCAIDRRTRFGLTEWSIALEAPAAGVVVGHVRSTIRGENETVRLEVGGSAIALEPVALDGTLRFAAQPGGEVSFVLRSLETTSVDEEDPVIDFDVVTLASVRPTHLRLRDQLLLHLRRGKVRQLSLELPAESIVHTVRGARVGGWRVEPDEGRLRVFFDEPPEDDPQDSRQAQTVSLEIVRDQALSRPSEASRDGGDERPLSGVNVVAATPWLERSRVTRATFALEADADGIVTLLDPGGSRSLDPNAEAGLLRLLPAAAVRTARAFDRSATPPSWEIVWPDEAPMLAATIDLLRVDWLWGASGSAGLRISARLRSRGLEVLDLELPPSFELTSAHLDDRAIEPGRQGNSWAIPLRVDSTTQRLAFEGVVQVERPTEGRTLELLVPAASAPISRVEVRAVLDGRYRYRLLDAERLEAAWQTPKPTQWDWPVPPGHTAVSATWSALSTRPEPLRLEVHDEPEEARWY